VPAVSTVPTISVSRARGAFARGVLAAAFALVLGGAATAQQDPGIFVKVPPVIAADSQQSPLDIRVGPDEATLLGASVAIRGLPSRSRLTVGELREPNTWIVPLAELQFLKVVVPAGFGGDYDITVELVRGTNDVMSAARSKIHFGTSEATASIEPAEPAPPPGSDPKAAGFLGRGVLFPIAPKQPEKQVIAPDLPETPLPPKPKAVARADVAAPVPSPPAPAVAPAPAPAPPPPAKSAQREPDTKQAALHEQKGRDALITGNVAAARLFFSRAVELGSASAALALAATYDPAELPKLGVLGVAPEPDTALKWYLKARELGAAEAERHITRLGAR